MKPKHSRKRLVGAVFRQARSAALDRLAEATRDLAQAERAMADLAETSRRLEREMRSAGLKGEVTAGRLEMNALSRERKRARHGEVEAERRALAGQLDAIGARVDAAKEAVAKAKRALDALDRRGA